MNPRPLLAILVLSGCGASPAQEAKTPEALPVNLAVARAVDHGQTISGTGTAAREREATLSFRVAGVLSHMAVDVGDPVRRDQSLASLAATDLSARLAERDAEVLRAERTLRRLEVLSAAGAVPRREFEDQRDTLSQTRAARAAARYDRDSARLVSPFSGVVLERIARAGETVAAGQAVLRVADYASPMIVRAPLPTEDADRVRLGSPAEVRFGDGAPIAASVARISRATSGSTGTRSVELRLADAHGVESGAVGRVRIHATTAAGQGDPDLVTVPAEAFMPVGDGRFAVYAVDPRRPIAVRRPVRLERFDGDDAVISGVAPGTRVITAGAGYVRDGQGVRIMAAPAP